MVQPVHPVRSKVVSGRRRRAQQARRFLDATLIQKVQRDHRQPDTAFKRRRIVAAVTLVFGAVLLGVSLSVRPADPAFYPLTFVLALTWTVGGFASGPLHLGYLPHRGDARRPILVPIALGLLIAGIFVLGALVIREVPPLHRIVETVLAHARQGSLPLVATVTLLNGVAEEIFFRGALYAGIGVRYPVAISTGIYAVVTLASGNLILVFAALTLGVVLALQRRASGGILGPILTHITWSMTMLFVLPPIFNG